VEEELLLAKGLGVVLIVVLAEDTRVYTPTYKASSARDEMGGIDERFGRRTFWSSKPGILW